jgi:hypothetical protein
MLRIVIPHQPTEMSYGSIFAKVNAESANVILQVKSTQEGIVCELDLARRGGFRLHPGRNSVEIAFFDGRHRLRYASFLLETLRQEPDSALPRYGPPDPPHGRIYGVVVGIAKYRSAGPGLPNPKFADRDAQDFYDFLISPAGGNVSRENIKLLLNEEAGRENLKTGLADFLGRAGQNDTVIFFFAGHGGADLDDEGPIQGKSNLYLATSDVDPGNMRGTAFAMSDLQQFFEDSVRAHNVIVIADACRILDVHSIQTAASARQNNLINQYLDRFSGAGNRAVITASDINQISQESQRWGGGHGVFAYFLLRGLQGEADLNSDGIVTLGELFSYVRDHVYKETAGAQRPIARPGMTASLALKRSSARASNLLN